MSAFQFHLHDCIIYSIMILFFYACVLCFIEKCLLFVLYTVPLACTVGLAKIYRAFEKAYSFGASVCTGHDHLNDSYIVM